MTIPFDIDRLLIGGHWRRAENDATLPIENPSTGREIGRIAAGSIADVDCAVGDTPCLTASDDHDYSIDEAEVIYWGKCPACSTEHSS